MRLFFSWPGLFALVIAALALLVAYDLSSEARYYVDQIFIWPIARAVRFAW